MPISTNSRTSASAITRPTNGSQKKTRRHCRSFLYNTPNDGSEIVILILDITDAITAHKALDEQEKLLRNIIQNAPVGIEIYNDRGRLIDINTCDLERSGQNTRAQPVRQP